MGHWSGGDASAEETAERYERQSRQQSATFNVKSSDVVDALIDTQKENIEALQRQIVALKRHAEDADGKVRRGPDTGSRTQLLVEADRAAKAEAHGQRLVKEARAFAIVKTNLETAVEKQEERLREYERQCKKLQNEIDAGAHQTDAQNDAERRKLDLKVKQLERELSDNKPSSLVGGRVADLEARITALQTENATLRSTAPVVKSRRRSSSFGIPVREDNGELDSLRTDNARLRAEAMKSENALQALQRSSTRDLATLREERDEAVAECNDIRRDMVDLDIDQLRADAGKVLAVRAELEAAQRRIGELKAVEEKSAEMEARLTTANNQVFDLSMQLEEVQAEADCVPELKQRLAHAEAGLSSATETIQASGARVADLEIALASARANADELRRALSASDSNLIAAKASEQMQLQIAQQAAKDLQAERAANIARLAAFEQRAKVWEAQEREMTALEAEVATLEEDFSAAGKQIVELEDEAHSLRKQCITRDEQINRLEVELDDSTRRLETVDASAAALEARATVAETALRSTQRQVTTLQDALREIEDRHEAATADLEALRGLPKRSYDDTEFEALQADLDTVLTEYKALQEQLSALEGVEAGLLTERREAEEVIESMRSELTTLRSDQAEAAFAQEGRVDDLLNQLKTAQEAAATLETRIEALDGDLADASTVRADLVSHRDRLAGEAAVNAGLSVQIEELKTNLRTATAALEDVKATLAERTIEARTAQEELKDAREAGQRTADELAQATTSLEDARSALTAAQTELTSLRADCDEVQHKLADVQSTLAARDMELSASHARVAELEEAEAPVNAPGSPTTTLRSWSAESQIAENLVHRLRYERDQAIDARDYLQLESDGIIETLEVRLQAAQVPKEVNESLHRLIVALALAERELKTLQSQSAQELERRVLRRTEQIGRLQTRIATLETENHSTEVTALKATVAQLEMNLALAEPLQDETFSVESVERLEAQIEGLKIQLADAEARLNSEAAQRRDQQAKAEALADVLQDAQDARRSLQGRLAEGDAKRAAEAERVRKLSVEIFGLRQELDVMAATFDELAAAQKTIEQLEAEVSAQTYVVEGAVQSANKLREELNDVRTELEQSEAECDLVRRSTTATLAESDQTVTALQQQVTELSQLCAERGEEVARLLGDCQQLSADLATARLASEDMAGLSKRLEESQTSIRSLQASSEAQSREIGTLRTLVATKDVELNATREEADALVNDFNMLSSELEKRQEHDERVAELEALLKRKEEEIEETDDKYLDSLKTIKQLKATVDRFKVKVEVLKQRDGSVRARVDAIEAAGPPVARKRSMPVEFDPEAAAPRAITVGPSPRRAQTAVRKDFKPKPRAPLSDLSVQAPPIRPLAVHRAIAPNGSLALFSAPDSE